MSCLTRRQRALLCGEQPSALSLKRQRKEIEIMPNASENSEQRKESSTRRPPAALAINWHQRCHLRKASTSQSHQLPSYIGKRKGDNVDPKKNLNISHVLVCFLTFRNVVFFLVFFAFGCFCVSVLSVFLYVLRFGVSFGVVVL